MLDNATDVAAAVARRADLRRATSRWIRAWRAHRQRVLLARRWHRRLVAARVLTSWAECAQRTRAIVLACRRAAMLRRGFDRLCETRELLSAHARALRRLDKTIRCEQLRGVLSRWRRRWREVVRVSHPASIRFRVRKCFRRWHIGTAGAWQAIRTAQLSQGLLEVTRRTDLGRSWQVWRIWYAARAQIVRAGKQADALQEAAREGQRERVNALLMVGVSANTHDPDDGATPLMLACRHGHIDVAIALLDAGADLNSTMADDWTALALAAHNGHCRVVRTLLARRASANTLSTDDDWTPLMLACAHGHEDTARALIEAGVALDARSSRGETALMAACRYGRMELARTLIERGADANLVTAEGSTALQLAEDCEQDVIGLLRERAGRPPMRLHAAAGSGDGGGRDGGGAAGESTALAALRAIVALGGEESTGQRALRQAATDGELAVLESLVQVGTATARVRFSLPLSRTRTRRAHARARGYARAIDTHALLARSRGLALSHAPPHARAARSTVLMRCLSLTRSQLLPPPLPRTLPCALPHPPPKLPPQPLLSCNSSDRCLCQ